MGENLKEDEDEKVPLVPKHLVPIVLYYNEKRIMYVDEGLENLAILLLGKKVTKYYKSTNPKPNPTTTFTRVYEKGENSRPTIVQ